LARHGKSFRSDKRRKELVRLQKQEEKRQKRFTGKGDQESDIEESPAEEQVSEEEEQNSEENEKE
jgi:hypothetical protein